MALPVLFYCIVLYFNLVLVLALVELWLCTISVLACCRPLAVEKHLNNTTEIKLIDLLLFRPIYIKNLYLSST
jgi:hypothetical protein